jgi:16S rRNA (guanine966-N2)-methyltransferase
MRITGGTHRGRKLTAPDGLGTRPTSDRARMAVFNILRHGHGVEDAVVLDAFAGTGALGLEALSQGAAEAFFIEKDRAALKSCRENIAALGFKTAHLISGDATSPPVAPKPCNLVFLDPPYGHGLVTAALVALRGKGWLADGALCVAEMAKKEPDDVPDGFELIDERAYGVALVRFLRMTA